jgi:hypothetical protein
MDELTRITYVSRSTFKQFKQQTGIEPNVARILLESRRNNVSRNLVGVLYYGDGCFFQCLEGKAQDIDKLLESLNRDTRHGDLKILSRNPIDHLSFINWEMKYVAVDEKVKNLLKKNNLSSFNPYKFSPDLVRELVDIFCQMSEPFSPGDVTEQAQVLDVNGQSLQPDSIQQNATVKVILGSLLVVLILIGIWMYLN